MQSQTFHGCDAANAELVFNDGNTIGVCPHICFECKRYAVLARLYAVIGKTVELLIVPNSGNHSIIPIISGIKMKCLISLACSINDIGDPSCQRLLFGESKSSALLLIAKSHQISTGTMLRNVGIFTSIRYKIAQKVIASRKFIVNYI